LSSSNSNGSFDVNSVYTLGNTWSQFGDTLNAQFAQLNSAVKSVQWTGEGGSAYLSAWEQINSVVLSQLPDMCYSIGEQINAYGTQAEAEEQKIAKEQEAADLAMAFGALLGLVLGIGAEAMEPLLQGVTSLITNLVARLGSIDVTLPVQFAVEAGVGAATQLGSDVISTAMGDAAAHVPFTVNWKSEGIAVAIGGAVGGLGALGGLGHGVTADTDTPVNVGGEDRIPDVNVPPVKAPDVAAPSAAASHDIRVGTLDTGVRVSSVSTTRQNPRSAAPGRASSPPDCPAADCRRPATSSRSCYPGQTRTLAPTGSARRRRRHSLRSAQRGTGLRRRQCNCCPKPCTRPNCRPGHRTGPAP
jgi:uncharacterized protein YukE